MLSWIGFLAIVVIVTILIRGKTTPIIPLVLVPIIAALIAGFTFSDIGEFFSAGMSSVLNVAIMFIFAIIFFGIMQDVGLFDPIIDKIVKATHGNVVLISVGTVFIAMIAQLDGSGASTFLITIPALLPLYRQMKMSPYLLLLLIAGSAGIMNMLPWAGPLGRAATVLEMDVTELWKPLIPIQIIGMLVMAALAFYLGKREQRRIIKQYGSVEQAIATKVDSFLGEEVESASEQVEVVATEQKRRMYVWNLLLTVLVIGVLVANILPAGLAFMSGTAIALLMNFRSAKLQGETIQRHAPNALTMASIILAAGTFLGILNGTGMLTSIAEDMVSILPSAVSSQIHIIIGLLGMPFELLLNTDAYYYGLLPVVEQIASTFGTAPEATAYAMIVGNIVGTFISPFSPALWMGLGLAGAELGKHIKYSFFWLWGVTLVLLGVAFTLGLF